MYEFVRFTTRHFKFLVSKSSCVYGWICGFHKDVPFVVVSKQRCVYGWICGLHNAKFRMSKQRHVCVCGRDTWGEV
jgi:hypothetical protein